MAPADFRFRANASEGKCARTELVEGLLGYNELVGSADQPPVSVDSHKLAGVVGFQAPCVSLVEPIVFGCSFRYPLLNAFSICHGGTPLEHNISRASKRSDTAA
jgi:hypothetical protein